MNPFLRKFLYVAQRYADAHVTEHGGNNRGDLVEHFQRATGNDPGEPWCASFVSCCAMEAHDALLRDLDECRLWLKRNYFLPSGSVREIMADAGNRGLFRTHEDINQGWVPNPGSLVIFHFNEGWHIGILKAWGDTITTIEGNTGLGNDRDGDGVSEKHRSQALVYGIVDLGAY